MKKIVISVLVLAFACNSFAGMWNFADDFADLSTPDCQWSLGLGMLPESAPGDFWSMPDPGHSVENYLDAEGVTAWHNQWMGTAVMINNSDSEKLGLQSGQVGANGTGSRNVAIRWTANESETLRVQGMFGKVADGENATEWIVYNNNDIREKFLFAENANSFDFEIAVNAGDIIDFVFATADLGAATIVPFDVEISSIPEPASIAILGLGMLALRKRKNG